MDCTHFRICIVFVIVISFAALSFLIYYSPVSAKSDEVAIRGSKALLSQGEAVKATIEAKKPTAMNEVSFTARTIGLADPFSISKIPLTVEVFEGDELVASESFTASLDDQYKKVNIDINNIPKMDEKYKLLIRYDVPENGGPNKIPVQIDTESIEINNGKDGLDVHGRIKIVFTS